MSVRWRRPCTATLAATVLLGLVWAIPIPPEKGVILFLGHLWDIRWEIQLPLTALVILLTLSFALAPRRDQRRR